MAKALLLILSLAAVSFAKDNRLVDRLMAANIDQQPESWPRINTCALLEPEIIAKRARAISIRPEDDPVTNDPRVSIQIDTCTAELLTVNATANAPVTLSETLIEDGVLTLAGKAAQLKLRKLPAVATPGTSDHFEGTVQAFTLDKAQVTSPVFDQRVGAKVRCYLSYCLKPVAGQPNRPTTCKQDNGAWIL
ncbi:hypothetical protein RvY_12294 [Ramazzottius varieornatus]|uniref:ZP domain-containing protein n=1 Tax=Ramazzottius varieornatus TaxID=947166 RepID=A0A1D1VLB7_RAMVA|nr:hypothetical protein RvY_12294 [Ramazzottius varieornatus]